MAKGVGIDIGSRAVKVAVLEGGPKGGRLLRFAEKEYEFGELAVLTPAIVLDALKKALAESKAPKHLACVAVPAEQCILREVSVPFTQDDQIEKVVKFEFEPHLHSAAIEDVVVDFIKIGPARLGTRLLVFACTKGVLTNKLTQLGQAGVDPLHLDVDVTALFNVAHAAGVLEKTPNCLIIDIGARTTKTLYIHEGRLKVARSIRLGSASASRRLEADMEGDQEAARLAMDRAAGIEALAAAPAGAHDTVEIVASVGAIETAVARSRQDEFLERVLRETQRTLPMMSEGDSISHVYVTGGGASAHPNARDSLEERFGAPVTDLPVLEAAPHDLAPSEADRVLRSGAVAVGTALKVLGVDAGQIDLRREEFRFSKTFDQIKNALATGVTLAFFAIFLLWLSLFMQQQKKGAELAALQRETEAQLNVDVFDAYQENVPSARTLQLSRDPVKYFQTSRSAMNRIRNHLKDELGLGTEVPAIFSSLEAWQVVMQSIGSVRDKVEYLALKEETYNQEKATLTVLLGKYTDVDVILGALRQHMPENGGTLFESVENRGITPGKDGRISVPIDIILLPKTREKPEEER